MRVIGIIWTLYPLLGLLAFLEFAIGLAHVFFCLPYAHFYLVFWSGISAGITSVYALLLDYPNKFFYLCVLSA
uniref:Transmembrane protein n=1 Tax=Meloidogyne incognita TaxID=6306 RepID=A0A914LP96_MELIC